MKITFTFVRNSNNLQNDFAQMKNLFYLCAVIREDAGGRHKLEAFGFVPYPVNLDNSLVYLE